MIVKSCSDLPSKCDRNSDTTVTVSFLCSEAELVEARAFVVRFLAISANRVVILFGRRVVMRIPSIAEPRRIATNG